MQSFAVVVWDVFGERCVEVFQCLRYVVETLFLYSPVESLEVRVVVRSAYA